MKKKIYWSLIFVTIICSQKTSAQMFWKQACSFAGTNTSYITVRNSATLDITGSFTIELWLNPLNATSPQFQSILQKRQGSNASGYTLYLSNGKIAIRTNSTTRLVGKTVLQNNVWTHVAGTYNSSTNIFRIYINGAQDTAATIAGAAPSSSTDSVFIGKGFNGPFAGKMDEVRIWNKELSTPESNTFRRISLGTNSGPYNGLVMSMTFQDDDNNGNAFILSDWTGNGNSGNNKGATAVDETNEPDQRTSLNECVNLDGSGAYLSGPDNSFVSPASELTLEAWIFRRSTSSGTIIHKGSANGSITDYRLEISGSALHAYINGNSLGSSSFNGVPINQWVHVAFTFDGGYTYYLNGNFIYGSGDTTSSIHNGSDSLYIGGTPNLSCFDGYIDEVRIINHRLSATEIKNLMYESIDISNQYPSYQNVVYNLDGYTTANTGIGPRLYFRGGAKFSYNASSNNVPVSPLCRESDLNFSKSFYLKTSLSKIPETGSSGYMIDDTIDIAANETVTDVNLFVALDHTNENNLTITLFNPSGQQSTVYSGQTLLGSGDYVVTVFDDQADSSLLSGRYISFGTDIKPANNMNTFSGHGTAGKWKLRIFDAAAGDTGRLYSWGLQFNNETKRKSVLTLTALMQGFYNPSTNLLTSDFMKVFLRGDNPPYAIADSAIAFLNASGLGKFTFANALDENDYYLVLRHRNSIETWSNSHSNSFSPFTSQLTVDFTGSAGVAFGNNLKQVDTSPVRYALYSGDVNQSGSIDALDISLTDNDVFNFVSGYVNTDVNGDNVVDAADLGNNR